jgi:SET domain-containing protein
MPHLNVKPQVTIWQLRVRRSPIQGLGVFAAEDIPKRRKVIEYTGERITRREAVKRFAKIWQSRKRNKRLCLFRLNKRWVLDGAVGGSGAEFINHSCAPNLASRRVRGHIFFFSRRPVRKGEELTVDYCLPKAAVRVACRCGSPACRGTINVR